MTFSCDYCSKQEVTFAEGEHVIREDLEIQLLEQGWWIVNNCFYRKVFCSQQCLENDLAV